MISKEVSHMSSDYDEITVINQKTVFELESKNYQALTAKIESLQVKGWVIEQSVHFYQKENRWRVTISYSSSTTVPDEISQ
jgi:hypothetical protein